MVTEIIRAELFTRYNQELPYNILQENVYAIGLNTVLAADFGMIA